MWEGLPHQRQDKREELSSSLSSCLSCGASLNLNQQSCPCVSVANGCVTLLKSL